MLVGTGPPSLETHGCWDGAQGPAVGSQPPQGHPCSCQVPCGARNGHECVPGAEPPTPHRGLSVALETPQCGQRCGQSHLGRPAPPPPNPGSQPYTHSNPPESQPQSPMAAPLSPSHPQGRGHSPRTGCPVQPPDWVPSVAIAGAAPSLSFAMGTASPRVRLGAARSLPLCQGARCQELTRRDVIRIPAAKQLPHAPSLTLPGNWAETGCYTHRGMLGCNGAGTQHPTPGELNLHLPSVLWVAGAVCRFWGVVAMGLGAAHSAQPPVTLADTPWHGTPSHNHHGTCPPAKCGVTQPAGS